MDTDFRKECENSNIKFSIIVPVYNVEKFLRESLDSIISQTLKDFEVICVNDGSTDNSLEILNEYAKSDFRFKIISQENQGQGLARNNAIDIAQGKYLLFVDPDDFIESNTLEVLYNKFQETDVDIIQFDYATCKEDGTHKRVETFKKRLKKYFNYSIKNNQIFNWHEIKKKNLEKMFLVIWDKAYKTSFIKEHNIKFAPNKIGEDQLFSISSIFSTNKILYMSVFLQIDDYNEFCSILMGCVNRNFSGKDFEYIPDNVQTKTFSTLFGFLVFGRKEGFKNLSL